MGKLEPRSSEQGFCGAQPLEEGVLPAAAAISEEALEAGFGRAGRKRRLEPTAAAGVMPAGKEETGTPVPFPHPAFQSSSSTFHCWNLMGRQQSWSLGSEVCRVSAPAMEQNMEGWIQAERH